MNRHSRIAMVFVYLCLCASVITFSTKVDAGTPEDTLARFDQFCRDTFGAKHEPLTYHLPGQELRVYDDGHWQWIGENSAAIAWETNLPASTYVEYGTTTDYGHRSDTSDRHHYIHLHRLRGLTPGTTYHYRLVSIDERDDSVLSPDRTFTPAKKPDTIYLPIAGQTPPFKLDQAGATYVLTEDIVAAGTALSVTAANVTIDLNGHTITYNDAPAVQDPDIQREFGHLATQGAQGVRCAYATRGSTRLYNGTIRQGRGGGGYGSLPVQFRGEEIAGVTIDYHGPQVFGIDGECKSAHHNVIIDRGTELTNRHQGVHAIKISGDVQRNLILRTRQNGVSAANGAKINRNEIYVDSCTTNSFGIQFYKTRNAEAIGNRVFGTGYLAIGIGTVSDGVGDIRITDNLIHMQATAPDSRWNEYGAQSGAYCVRVTWGGENIEYADNVMVSRGRDGGMVRGVWFCPAPGIDNVSFRRNVIKVLAENDATTKWGAIVISGEDTPESRPGLFEQNTVISNFCNVRLGEQYGAGVNARFVNNTFVRDGDDQRYATIICGFGSFNNVGSVFVDSRFEGGAGFDRLRWEGTGRNEFSEGKLVDGDVVIERTYERKSD